MLRERSGVAVQEIPPPTTDADSAAAREQMQRMLRHPLFRSGRRCPALFQYIVEQSLEKNTALLKERVIGAEVFGRAPDYDTNADSVVRTAAAELRKRIAQYYQQSGHETELRIELRSGSYVPGFRAPEPSATEFSPPEPNPAVQRARWHSRAVPAALAALAVCAAAGFLLKTLHPAPALDRFWAPLLESPGTVMLCVGQRLKQPRAIAGEEDRQILPSESTPPADVPLFRFYWMAAQNVALPDVIAISKLSGLLQSKRKSFRIRPESNATFDDLRGGPAILIGGFRNEWTERLMSHWRFRPMGDGQTSWIADRDHPNLRNRVVNYRQPYTSVTEDFAVVSRAVDPTSGRPVVVVAGAAGYGTMAAAEFVTDAAAFGQIEKRAPAGWDGRSVQIVLRTSVIGKSPGPPEIVATHFW